MGALLLCFTIIFFGCLLGLGAQRVFKKLTPWVLSIIPLSVFILLLKKLPDVLSGNSVKEAYTWVPGLDFNLQFHLDGLSLLFALLITGIGALIVIYGGTYLSKDNNLPRFYAFLFLFMGAMLGVVLSDNIFALFVFWELTSLSSYLLIGYKHGYEDARKSALQALLVTGMGGLALLAGLILASLAGGSPVISEWSADENLFSAHKHFALLLTLILVGAFTKSAQFPFHFWLPNAMAAPTPVSAYLHSATMVKAGVYLLARMQPYFAGAEAWHFALTFFGGATMLIGAVWALFQTDLKKILAYTTISALGVLVFFIGIGTPEAIQGAMVFLLAHAFYKGGLFMIAGNVDHAAGSRDVRQLSGLWRGMKFNGTAAMLTTLSMAGFPFLLGFIAKELLYETTFHAPYTAVLFTSIIFITGVIFASIAVLLGWKIFFRKGKNEFKKSDIHEVSLGMYLGPMVLAACGLIAGILPQASVGGLLSAAALSVSKNAGGLELHLWHGFTPVLGLSVLTLLLGVLLFRYTDFFKAKNASLSSFEKFGPEAIYNFSWENLILFAKKLVAFIQSGYLRYYVMTIIITLFGLAFLTIWKYKLFALNTSFTGVDVYEILLAILVAVAIFFTVIASSRLAAIAILGVVGYGIAVFYSIYGAPDLAMTQFLIETLTVVVFVYVLYKLPGYIKLSPGINRYRDIAIAVAGGTMMTLIILLVTNFPLTSELKLFYAENSYVLAKGRNVVNVILVDFRALDTMGEIVVLSIAALGVFALSKLRIQSESNKI